MNTDKNVYTTRDHVTPSYVRNPACWAASLDLTGVGVWRSDTGDGLGAGAVITARHAMCAAHANIGNGTVIRFITSTNTVVERTVVGSQNPAMDAAVVALDSDLPATIKPFKLLPVNLATYWPTSTDARVPCLCFDAEEKAFIRDVESIPTSLNALNIGCVNSVRYASLTETIVGGDSGNPFFTIINGEAILMSCWETNGGGPPYHLMLTQIQTACDALNAGYTIQTVDLSSF